jgi:hypothetical protein
MLSSACGVALVGTWTDLFTRVATCMKVSSIARFDAVLSNDMIVGLLLTAHMPVFSALGEVHQK